MKKFALLDNYIVSDSENNLLSKDAVIIPEDFWWSLTDSRTETDELMIWNENNYIPVFIGSDISEILKSYIKAYTILKDKQKNLDIEKTESLKVCFNESIEMLLFSFDSMAKFLAYPETQKKLKMLDMN
jgi:hypothetical protein